MKENLGYKKITKKRGTETRHIFKEPTEPEETTDKFDIKKTIIELEQTQKELVDPKKIIKLILNFLEIKKLTTEEVDTLTDIKRVETKLILHKIKKITQEELFTFLEKNGINIKQKNQYEN